MVYGPYGRTGVYPMQQMLRQLAGDRTLAEQVQIARRLWSALPATNWLRRNPFISDHKRTDAELVDLLLHARDRSYTVPEFAELLDAGGLVPTALVEPARYAPETYLSDPKLTRPLADAGLVDRAAFAERLAGNQRKHIAYAAPTDAGDTVAPFDTAAVPVMPGSDPQALAGKLAGLQQLKTKLDGIPVAFPLPRLTAPILRLVDGRTSVADIVANLRASDGGLDEATAHKQVERVYRAFNGLNLMLLRR
jgi:hypothetical protein